MKEANELGYCCYGGTKPRANCASCAAWKPVIGNPISEQHQPVTPATETVLRAALVEARRWIGDGDLSDGLHRDHWTPQYRAAVDMIDAVLGDASEGGS